MDKQRLSFSALDLTLVDVFSSDISDLVVVIYTYIV